MTDIKIITHFGAFGASNADNMIDTAMRVIAVGFGDPDEWSSKYGTDFENDVFSMRRYYWGDCTCGMMDLGPSEPEQNCQPTCEMQIPNFKFKPSGFEIRWYKYIGRGMEFSDECLPSDFMQQIFASHPKGTTVDEAIQELAKREEERAKAFAEMFASLGVEVT